MIWIEGKTWRVSTSLALQYCYPPCYSEDVSTLSLICRLSLVGSFQLCGTHGCSKSCQPDPCSGDELLRREQRVVPVQSHWEDQTSLQPQVPRAHATVDQVYCLHSVDQFSRKLLRLVHCLCFDIHGVGRSVRNVAVIVVFLLVDFFIPFNTSKGR
jgi:hypothetical protein